MSACATCWSSFARTVPSTRTNLYSSGTMSDARGSRARFSGFLLPAAVLNMISSPSSAYHMTVRCAEPSSFVVPSTANRGSWRKSRSACVNSRRTTPPPVKVLAEQVAVRRTDVLLRGLRGLVERETAHQRDGAAIELSHNELGRAGDLVSDGDLGDAQLVALGIALANVTLEGGQSREPDRDVGVAFAPRPSERVGDDHGDGRAGGPAERLTQPRRRRVGVDRKEHDGVGSAGVRAIDARVRAHEAMSRLAYQDAALPAHDLRAFREHDFDLARVLAGRRCHLLRTLTRHDIREPDD